MKTNELHPKKLALPGRPGKAFLLALVLGTVGLLTAIPAAAADWHFGFRVGGRPIHQPHPVVRPAPAPVIMPRPAPIMVPGPVVIRNPHQRLPGYYETRTERILVEPARFERQYVPPVYATQYARCGLAYQVQVQPGYHREVYVPARYETRTYQVWVPGHCPT